MFDYGFGEMIGLVILALILVGPERMPRVAGDLAKMIRKVRSLTNTATAEIRENLGPGFEDLKPADLNLNCSYICCCYATKYLGLFYIRTFRINNRAFCR